MEMTLGECEREKKILTNIAGLHFYKGLKEASECTRRKFDVDGNPRGKLLPNSQSERYFYLRRINDSVDKRRGGRAFVCSEEKFTNSHVRVCTQNLSFTAV